MTKNNAKTILTFSLATVAISLVAGTTIAYADFSGDYNPSNWTLSKNGGDGSVDTQFAPGTIVLTGSDTETGNNIDTDYTVPVVTVCGATIDFDWDYKSIDDPDYDTAFYLLNGGQTFLSTNSGENGSESVPVFAGDVFGFRVNTMDDFAGPGVLEVSNFSVAPDASCADIDIKPNSDPNSINLNQKGLIPVAILGSDTYDVTDVDFSTLNFEGAIPKHQAGHIEDVNGDNYPDLVAHFPTQDIGLAAYAPEGCLTWEDSLTTNIACDSTRVFDPKNGDKPNP